MTTKQTNINNKVNSNKQNFNIPSLIGMCFFYNNFRKLQVRRVLWTPLTVGTKKSIQSIQINYGSLVLSNSFFYRFFPFPNKRIDFIVINKLNYFKVIDNNYYFSTWSVLSFSSNNSEQAGRDVNTISFPLFENLTLSWSCFSIVKKFTCF